MHYNLRNVITVKTTQSKQTFIYLHDIYFPLCIFDWRINPLKDVSYLAHVQKWNEHKKKEIQNTETKYHPPNLKEITLTKLHEAVSTNIYVIYFHIFSNLRLDGVV